jgi:phenylacetate-coenzyme A ligase PaaK-like adenylate-forming protein
MKSMIKQYIKKNKKLEYLVRKIYSLIPYEKRKLGKEYYDFFNLLKLNEKKSIEEIKQYQFEKLKKIINIAYINTAFYKDKYDRVNFHPSMLNSLDDIKKIPVLTKNEIRNNALAMINKQIDIKSLTKGFTSGTTGKALELYYDKKTTSREWASICYQWERVGYRVGDGRIELRGFIQDERDFLYLPDERVLRINIIKMNKLNIDRIINKINDVGYKFIHGYPSAIFKFAKIIESCKISYSPTAIMMASEVLYDWQMKVIDDTFNCNKIIHYGQAEKVALGAWTDKRKYSFIPSYGLVEYDQNSKELIATGFINEAMPLIRYQLTDTIDSVSHIPLSKDKSLYPVISDIYGREEDFTYDENKNLIPPAVVTFPFKQLKYIDAAKIIQNDINKFELILETKINNENKNLNNEIKTLIIDFKKLYGNKSEFEIVLTNDIPLGKNGKFRWIECKIK